MIVLIVRWTNSGVVELWSCGAVELWSCGAVELWSCGAVELWSCDWKSLFFLHESLPLKDEISISSLHHSDNEYISGNRFQLILGLPRRKT
jgi:hypothetical protein